MKRIYFFFFLALILLNYTSAFSQYSKSDSLRGGYGIERSSWNLLKMNLEVEFNVANKSISGKNSLLFDFINTLQIPSKIQIDLQKPLQIDSVIFNGKKVDFSKIENVGNAYFIPITAIFCRLKVQEELTVFYHGIPREAKRAPWDGGLIWSKDKNNIDWISIACQGLGASVWFPCKDSQQDEPENGVRATYIHPSDLVCVANGKQINKTVLSNSRCKTTWEVKNPINNYCIVPYFGDYKNSSELYKGKKGELTLNYWYLSYNQEKALKQFQEVPKMLTSFEDWFGQYPFYEDGYQLIEAPHLGMEHQSAIAYGNDFKQGYAGSDLSGTGEGMKFDFIIVHESGHEWYGNNITTKDIADMWVHEGFTCYSETLFLETHFGKEAAMRYCKGIQKNIGNDSPIIGDYEVQKEGSGDMYYKGANMLNTIRYGLNNDSLFKAMLLQMNRTFYHQTVTSKQIEDFMEDFLKIPLKGVFNQYLRTTNIPVFEYKWKRKKLTFRYFNIESDFQLPLNINGTWVKPTSQWQKIPMKQKPMLEFAAYIYVKKV